MPIFLAFAAVVLLLAWWRGSPYLALGMAGPRWAQPLQLAGAYPALHGQFTAFYRVNPLHWP